MLGGALDVFFSHQRMSTCFLRGVITSISKESYSHFIFLEWGCSLPVPSPLSGSAHAGLAEKILGLRPFFVSLDHIYLRNDTFSLSEHFTMSISSPSLSKFCAIKNPIHKAGCFNNCIIMMFFCLGRCVR